MSEPELDRCVLEPLLSIVCKKWTARIIFILGENNSLRFGELRRAFDKKITAKALSEKLQVLVTERFVTRTEGGDVVREVHYELTPQGACIHRALKQMEGDLRMAGAI